MPLRRGGLRKVYFQICNTPVYITWRALREIDQIVLEHKGVPFKMSTQIAGTREEREATELRIKFLEEEYRKDPVLFYEKWVNFDLMDDEARSETWDLLFDYCHFRGWGRLIDVRDFQERLLSDLMGESLQYPMGKAFLLTIPIMTPKALLSRLLSSSKGPELSVVIDTSGVRRLAGSLAEFTLYSDDYVIRFGSNITFYPPDYAV